VSHYWKTHMTCLARCIVIFIWCHLTNSTFLISLPTSKTFTCISVRVLERHQPPHMPPHLASTSHNRITTAMQPQCNPIATQRATLIRRNAPTRFTNKQKHEKIKKAWCRNTTSSCQTDFFLLYLVARCY
jgi:hypothetical protein